MKGKSEANFKDIFFIVHRSGSTHMFLLQALGWWLYEQGREVYLSKGASVAMKQTSHPVNLKTQQEIT